MNLTKIPQNQRPREKLLTQGAAALTDAELLAIFLRTGARGRNAVELGSALIARFGSLRGLLNADFEACSQVRGLGQVKFAQLQAVIETAKRYFRESMSHDSVFESAEQTRTFLLSQMRDEVNEVFAMLALDSQHRLINFKKLFFGTINAASVYPRVIVQQALSDNAAAIILVHNHPSGVAEPSHADKNITNRICVAMELVDVKVLDHFVIGDGYAVSFAERGLL